jgi:hypothetical protein
MAPCFIFVHGSRHVIGVAAATMGQPSLAGVLAGGWLHHPQIFIPHVASRSKARGGQAISSPLYLEGIHAGSLVCF